MQNQTKRGRSTFIASAVIMALLSMGSLLSAGEDNAAIDKVRSDFNAAFNAGNAQAMGDLIDENGIWLPPGMATSTGKANIVPHYRDYFAKFRTKFELKAGSVEACDGWAFISGDFTRTDIPKAGGASRNFWGHYLLVLKKQPDGKWKIARDIWSDSVKLKGKP